MSASTVDLILWAPFAVVCVVCGILFSIAGLRRGVLNALVSLGGTLASAALSLGIAKLVAGFLAPVVMKVLPVVSPETMAEMGETLQGMVESIAAMVAAMALFMVLMLILTPVAKGLLKLFVRLPKGSKKMKWGGLAVRIVDTVLFAFLLLAPIYGTLYNYLPVAEAVLEMNQEQDPTVAACVAQAQKHPVVKLSGVGPADWVYKGLSQLSSGEVSVNATTLTETVQEIMALMNEAQQGESAAGNAQTTKKLLEYARDHLLEQEWCSELVANVGLDYLKQQAAALGGEDSLLTEVMSGLKISPEQLQTDGKGLLDLAIGVMDMQSGAIADEEAAQALSQKLSEAFTSNETMQQLKEQVYTKAVTKLLGDDSQQTQDAIREQLGSVELTQEEQMEEAQAFLQLLTGGDQAEAVNKLVELGVLSGELAERIPTGE